MLIVTVVFVAIIAALFDVLFLFLPLVMLALRTFPFVLALLLAIPLASPLLTFFFLPFLASSFLLAFRIPSALIPIPMGAALIIGTVFLVRILVATR